MNLLDRHILTRFLANFLILFVIMFVFAATIDLVIALDEFVEAAELQAGPEASRITRFLILLKLGLDFQFPRIFQFYAFLHGILAVGAMGFTLSRMYKAKELVAMLAAGISMHRIAMPFVIGMFVLSLGQLVNQELLLPRVAPLLIRGHEEIGQRTVEAFPVDFTQDDAGTLFQSPRFDPDAQTLERPTILVRDERGRTRQRITAELATWQPGVGAGGPEDGSGAAGTDDGASDAGPATRAGWRLTDGRSVRLSNIGDPDSADPAVSDADMTMVRESVDFVGTDLSPRVLVLRRHGAYASMLSLTQISEILDAQGAIDRASLVESLYRYRYARFSAVLVNVLLMWLALPTFLLRSPANLLRQSLLCAAITLPAVIASAIFVLARVPGIPPAVAVWLPALLLSFVVLAQWTTVRT